MDSRSYVNRVRIRWRTWVNFFFRFLNSKSHKVRALPSDVIGNHCSGVNCQNPNTMRHPKGRNGTLGSGGP